MKLVTTIAAVSILLLAGALAACSDKDADATAGKAAQAATQAAEPPQRQAQLGGSASTRDGQGDCDLLTAAELDAAFGGHLSFGPMNGRGARGRACTVGLRGGAEGQLTVQADNHKTFEMRKQSAIGQGVRMEPIELGIEAEAYRVNDLQVIADAGNDRALSIGLLVVFPRGDAPISMGEMAQGVETLARQAMARLEGPAAQ